MLPGARRAARLTIASAMLLPALAHAFPAVGIRDQSAHCDSGRRYEDSSDFFAPYELNSFLIKKTGGGVGLSSEINISVRYFFKSQVEQAPAPAPAARASGPDSVPDLNISSADENGCPPPPARYVRATVGRFNPFFSYTARYDFFWVPVRETRPSAPVVSRYQNPALHLRYAIPGKGPDDWGDVGLEHISNGQALTAKDNIPQLQQAYTSRNYPLLDSVSRTDAMFALTLEGSHQIDDNNVVALKLFLMRTGQEADVYWGKYANTDVNYNDFQLARFQWRFKFHAPQASVQLPWQFGAEMTVGRYGMPEASWNFQLETPVSIFSYHIPLAFTMHRGPMNTLATYTLHQNSFAAGFTFAY